MNNSLAARTLDRASSAMRKETVACLPEIVKLMRTLSCNSSQVSVPELAAVIQKDPIIFTKVLTAANTLGYNPGRVPVTTVDEAIHIIGYERIRTLAMSLLLVEQTSRSQGADEQREVAVIALTAGSIAQAAAASRSMLDPDEAFVCASLRSFGRIVMVTCMLDDYRAAQNLADTQSSDDAYRTTFGLTPLELGHQLLLAAELPEELLLTMRALPAEALASLNSTPSAQMLALTDFAAQLAELAMSPQLTAAAFTEKSQALAHRYTHLFPELAEEVLPLVENATQQLNDFVGTLRIKSLPPRLLTRLRHRSESTDPVIVARPAPVKPATPVPFTVPAPATPTDPRLAAVAAHNEAVASFCWQTEIDKLAVLARSGRGSRNALLSAIVDSVQRGFAAADCLLFSKAEGSSIFELTHGRGRSFASLGQRARLRTSDRTIFGVCLTRGENVVIHRAADPKIIPYLPDWLRTEDSLSSFVLLPLTAGGQTDGLVLAGWPTPRQVVIASAQAQLIRSLLAACISSRSAA